MRQIRLENEQIKLRNSLKAEKNKFKKSNQMNTSTKVLIASIIAIVSFTIACLYIQYNIGTEVSSTLITLWFSFWTVEIVALTGIKISKVIRNQNINTNEEKVELNGDNDDDVNNTDAVG